MTRRSSNQAKADYLQSRANSMRNSYNGDDRQSMQKRNEDAVLRGKIGRDAANKLIKEVDYIASQR